MDDLRSVFGLHGIGEREACAALAELCAAGLLTCTRGQPGEPGATYAVAWLPLDNPENFPAEVRERHAANLARFTSTERRTTR